MNHEEKENKIEREEQENQRVWRSLIIRGIERNTKIRGRNEKNHEMSLESRRSEEGRKRIRKCL